MLKKGILMFKFKTRPLAHLSSLCKLLYLVNFIRLLRTISEQCQQKIEKDAVSKNLILTYFSNQLLINSNLQRWVEYSDFEYLHLKLSIFQNNFFYYFNMIYHRLIMIVFEIY
jgi:hypothetical protein